MQEEKILNAVYPTQDIKLFQNLKVDQKKNFALDNELMEILRFKNGSTIRRQSNQLFLQSVRNKSMAQFKDQALFQTARNLRQTPMVSAYAYLIYILVSYIFAEFFPAVAMKVAKPLIFMENAIYIYCIFSFLRFSVFISSEHSVLHDYKIFRKTVTLCFVATIVGYQRQIIQHYFSFESIKFQMASSVELFFIIWLVSAQYSCDVEDLEEDYSIPLITKGAQECNLQVR